MVVKKHNRRSIRLPDYDYSGFGYYYVTICTFEHEYDLGEIENGKIKLSKIGRIAQQFWLNTQEHFENIELDEYVIMPNHLHGIIIININNVGAQNFEPLRKNKFQHIIPKSLGSIIRTYKSAVKHWCNQNNNEYFFWQRNYFERIIRNQKELNHSRDYIINNPINWGSDRNNPKNFK